MVYKKDINKLFRELRKAGFYAKQDYWCCQSCGWADVPAGTQKVVFYHNQDTERAFGGTHYLVDGLMLAWGGQASTKVIVRELSKTIINCGLKFSWDGSEDSRFEILPEKDD